MISYPPLSLLAQAAQNFPRPFFPTFPTCLHRPLSRRRIPYSRICRPLQLLSQTGCAPKLKRT